jgi:hypothetical protein
LEILKGVEVSRCRTTAASPTVRGHTVDFMEHADLASTIGDGPTVRISVRGGLSRSNGQAVNEAA